MRMRRLGKQERGQFIVIAALMVAIMIVSIGAIMYGAVTYFKYERWEEYLAIIDNVKLGSQRVVEMSLASYTLTSNNETLKNNLDQWRCNITKAYPGFGVILTYSNASGSHYAYGVNMKYSSGLASYWYNRTSFSAANATFTLNITSVGLTGYEFNAFAFLRTRILDVVWSSRDKALTIRLTVEREGLTPITNLKKSNFQVNVAGYASANFSLARYYNVTYGFFLYEIELQSISREPQGVTVTVVDTRGVKVIAGSGVTGVLPRVPAVIGYRSSTGTYGLSSPKVRTWNGTVWLSERELPSAGSPVRFVRAAYCPLAARYYEKIVVTLSEDGYLDAYVWNDTAWIVTNNIGLTATSTPSSRMFDIEYEKTSGEALLVYSKGYRIWNGSAWSGETLYNITSPPTDVRWIALAQNPTSGSDKIALIALDKSKLVYGLIWNGSQFSGLKLLGTAPSETKECIAVAYESTSGYATFVWAGADRYSYSRQWNGSAWDALPTRINLNGGTTLDVWLSLKADPVSDKLMLLDVDDAEDLNTAYWNGSSWTVTLDHDTAVDTKASRCADLGWEPSGSKVLMVWGTSTSKLSYKTWTPSGGWSSENTITKEIAGTHPWVQLRRNSLSTVPTKILGATLDSNVDLGSLRWDGTTLTSTAGAFTTDTGVTSYECFEVEFQKFASPT